MTFYLAGFPGTGKSTLHKNCNTIMTADSDSSMFSKLEDGSPNPNFIDDYFEHLESLDESGVVLVFISTHEAVLKELQERNYKFTVIVPKQELKEEYLERYKKRGSPQALIDIIDKNWHAWLEDIKSKYKNVYELSSGEYIADYVFDTYDRHVSESVKKYSKYS